MNCRLPCLDRRFVSGRQNSSARYNRDCDPLLNPSGFRRLFPTTISISLSRLPTLWTCVPKWALSSTTACPESIAFFHWRTQREGRWPARYPRRDSYRYPNAREYQYPINISTLCLCWSSSALNLRGNCLISVLSCHLRPSCNAYFRFSIRVPLDGVSSALEMNIKASYTFLISCIVG